MMLYFSLGLVVGVYMGIIVTLYFSNKDKQ